MKINPILNKKIFGLPVNEIIGIICAITCADIFDSNVSIGTEWLRWALWMVMWIVGIVLYTVVIALIKTYITKEE